MAGSLPRALGSEPAVHRSPLSNTRAWLVTYPELWVGTSRAPVLLSGTRCTAGSYQALGVTGAPVLLSGTRCTAGSYQALGMTGAGITEWYPVHGWFLSGSGCDRSTGITEW